MNLPLVSVVISTYNRLSLLERALKSLEDQSFKDFEVIVSDDCSTVDVESFIQSYKLESGLDITYRCNKVNSGACYTRNEGIKIARGKYITGLDDDDEFTSDRLSYLVSNLNDKYSFVASNTLVVTKNKSIALFNKRKPKKISYVDSLWGNRTGTQILTKKEYLLGAGGFDVTLSSGQDAEMWLRLLKKYGVGLRLPEVTYVLHTEHDAPRISTSKKKLDGMLKISSQYSYDRNLSQNKFSKLKIEYYKNNKAIKIYYLKYISLSLLVYLLKKKFKWI
ncbi:MAG: glycosyltransferase [Pseudoalteromonas sp.]